MWVSLIGLIYSILLFFLSVIANTDKENGETIVHCPKVSSSTPPAPPPKPGNASLNHLNAHMHTVNEFIYHFKHIVLTFMSV